ncbi:MAG: hypothetical protein V4621_02035 [Pseudomonadota bacterium]
MDLSAYQKIEGRELDKYIPLANAVLPGTKLVKASVQMLRARPGFYPDCVILDIQDRQAHPPRQVTIVTNQNTTQIIDYSAATLTQMNDIFGLTLNDETIHDYIRFYFRYTQGPQGRFILLEGVDDVPWRDEPPPAARKAMGEMIRSLPVAMEKTKLGWGGQVSLIFQNAFFTADLAVTREGQVTLSHERLMIDQMPIWDDVILD